MSGVVQQDSVLKLAHYVAMIATAPFDCAGQAFNPPRDLAISPTFWRDYTCPEGCGGCCRAFSMDFNMAEFERFSVVYPALIKQFRTREIVINGTRQVYYSNLHTAQARYRAKLYCAFLDTQGRCTIHDYSPFTCQFELNKLQFFPKRDRAILGKKVYRNGWRYQRVDGGRGALCEMIAVSAQTVATVLRRDVPLIARLASYADDWGVAHRGAAVLQQLRAVRGIDALRMSEV